ncbi:MAG: DAK2 domain-containing protein [Actinomycetota bacterium]
MVFDWLVRELQMPVRILAAVTKRRLLLKAQDLKQVLQRYLDRLHQYREALNRLNVYPVPDGDTGTNMTLTVESVVAATDGAESMNQVATAIAHGSLMGAQGNSGIILSQILRGLADAFRDETTVGADQIVDALDRASTAAYKAVGRPVEGTILTVLREAAAAAADNETRAGEDLADLLLRVYRRAEQALADTPELLPVLKEAGVVDAGGAGFLLLLVAFLEEVTGEDVVLPEAIFRAAAEQLVPAAGGGDIASLRYEVMFLLRSEKASAGDQLRTDWSTLGDSIVVVGDEGVWNCHIHTESVGPAIEAGIALGRPERIKVTDLLDQAADEAHHRERRFKPLSAFAASPVGVVAVAVGDGVIALFRDAGVQGVVVGGQTMNPSVRDLLGVVEEVAAQTVIVLPNNKNIIPVAEQLDALTDKKVLVVSTRSIPEGLAAMLAFMPGNDAVESVDDMTKAAVACGWGEVTRAVRDAVTPAGRIREGDWLGIVNGDVSVIAPTPGVAAIGVIGALVTEAAEVVTVITGTEADRNTTAEITEHLDAEHDLVVTVVAGGQPLYPYWFGVE